MKRNVQGIKQGNVVNVFIDGKLHKKNCGSAKESDELFKLVLKAKEDPSDDNIKKIRMYFNEKLRTALLAGLESDIETGEVYLEGFNTPIPATLVDVFKEYHEKGYPTDAILNFWKLLMINPDKRVRESLFDFITTHDFVLTDAGYMVVYKAVYYKDEQKEKKDKTFEEFISNQYVFVKDKWSCSPNKYVAYKNIDEDSAEYGKLFITKYETAKHWDEKEKGVEILGKLGDLYAAIITAENQEEEKTNVQYTDMHSRTMTIEIGKPVLMDRKACDSDPARDCSYGLHVGATKYVERFGNSDSPVLVCLVNPMHVVAVPEYDHSKMRVAEYFPFAYANYIDGKIEIVEQMYFESDYCAYEKGEVEALIAKVKAEELPLAKTIGAEEETRDMAELMKILESRLVDL